MKTRDTAYALTADTDDATSPTVMRGGVPTVRRTYDDDSSALVPEVLSPRIDDNLEASVRSPRQQSMTWGDVRQVGLYRKGMEHYSEAMRHAADASKHALTIASNTVAIHEARLKLFEKREEALATIEEHRLKRDGFRQQRVVLKQTEGTTLALAHASVHREYLKVKYGQAEDHADHVNNMNERRETLAEHDARMKAHAVDVERDLKLRRKRVDDVDKEGRVDDAAKAKAIANRTLLDVAEGHVICDPSHLYHAPAAIWYWGARRRGASHEQAAAMTTERLIERMTTDPVTLPEASKDFKKWVEMEEEMRNAAEAARVEQEIADERRERDKAMAAATERERLKTEAARERRRTAETTFDTFGGDLGDIDH